MKLVEELRDLKSNNLIITGDGSNEFHIMKELCKKYNGHNKLLWFPRTPLLIKKGLCALDTIKIYLNNQIFGINSIIYLVDGEYIEEDAINEIQDHLNSIGVNIIDVSPINEAFAIRCISGNYEVILYCIVSGTETCIEEEIAKLIDLEYGVKINLSGDRDSGWKTRIKKEIRQILKGRNKNLEELIRNAEKSKLERSFPNICAVLRRIEESFQF